MNKGNCLPRLGNVLNRVTVCWPQQYSRCGSEINYEINIDVLTAEKIDRYFVTVTKIKVHG